MTQLVKPKGSNSLAWQFWGHGKKPWSYVNGAGEWRSESSGESGFLTAVVLVR